MITEKSHDIDNLFKTLDGALEVALEDGEIAGLWVQQYDDLGVELWAASFTKPETGKAILTPIEIEGVKGGYRKIMEEDGEPEELIEALNDIVFQRWRERDTLQIKSLTYGDHYDLYGMKREDFFNYSF